MGIKNGYGSITERLESLEVLGILVASNRNLIFQFPSKNEKRIFTITAGYTLPDASSATGIVGGRLLVVGGRYDNNEEFIDAQGGGLPDSLSSLNIYFDAPVIAANNNHFDFNSGLLIPKGQDASVILTFCETTGGATYPASDIVIGFLNVVGFIGGSDKIFKNIT